MSTPIDVSSDALKYDISLLEKVDLIGKVVEEMAELYQVTVKGVKIVVDHALPRLELQVYLLRDFSQDVAQFMQTFPVVASQRITVNYPVTGTQLFASVHPFLLD